tara:strand:+ start:552 stop:755 length:204 start_codon:yes stop_codon:yes gene_type:complete
VIQDLSTKNTFPAESKKSRACTISKQGPIYATPKATKPLKCNYSYGPKQLFDNDWENIEEEKSLKKK